MNVHFASVLVALTLVACASAPQSGAAAAPVASAATLGVFTSDASGFNTNTYFYDTGSEVVVFDAQFSPALAEQAIQTIRAQTRHPITWLVVTHPNPDKFNGASAFQAVGAKVVASAATARAIPGVHAYKKNYFVNVAKMFTEATYPAEAHVDVTFEGEMTLPLADGADVVLRDLASPGVSSTQTIAFVPAVHALVVGDLVHVKTHAWLEGGIVEGKPRPTLDSWKRLLDVIAKYDGATVYGGRGAPAPAASAAAAEKAYLDTVDGIVTKYVAALGGRTTELTGPNAETHWKAITDLATKAYPDYALPYMIDYGVYGLALQIADQI